MRGTNRVALAGTLIELGRLRYTPAGVPVIDFRLRHESRRTEAGAERAVSAELEAIAFEAQANLMSGAAPGSPLRLEGFLCAKSRRSKKLVLHATHIEFVEGD